MDRLKNKFKGAFADYFKEVIYGGIDGIVTTFAVVAGGAGASLSSDTTTQISFVVVLLFGLANLFADAASMGLGNFLSVRSEKDLYMVTRERELAGLKADPETEKAETMRILQDKGFTQEDANILANTYKNNENYWLDFMMHHKLEQSDPRGENEIFTGLATFFSFMAFGSIPLLPFMLQENGDHSTAFLYSTLGTLFALVVLGLLKWRVIGANLKSSLFEVVAVGGTAAVLAYFVGTFFAL
ncbi:VIT1/CCC1 transporter family protein [Candidatus Nomurabacteria bacterium]|nr:VIT1/CCC1 transporter family protein [Candidatus Kaiserbacteria bacterium]MCB9815320.1 VIT1/CCC1 transporter family protein [Candidatus Nomurabacteria bacterium]MCB9819543.1 VIT1/CCC1 transporter family protein [Candidatus Nomurabacteria bacterium]